MRIAAVAGRPWPTDAIGWRRDDAAAALAFRRAQQLRPDLPVVKKKAREMAETRVTLTTMRRR